MISDIEIRLRADIARLQQDMNRARQTVDGGLNSINNAVAKTMGMLGGLAIGAGAVSFGKFIKGSIDAADALNDLSARSKVAVEDLAGLDFAAKMTGTTLEGAAGAVSKLTLNMGKDAEKFRQLGVTAQEPLEALKQLADIFKDIQDPQQRAAFGAAALGKQWAEVAPLLDEGAAGIDELVKRGKDLSGVTEQTARDAAAFNDKLDELTVAAQGFGTRLAADLLPLMNKLSESFTVTGQSAANSAKETSTLVIVLNDIVVVGRAIALIFELVGKTGSAAVGQVVAFGDAIFDLLSLDFSGFISNIKQIPGIGRAFLDDAGDAVEGFASWERGIRSVGQATDTAGDQITKFIEDVDKAVAAGEKAAQVQEFIKSEEVAAARKKAADESVKAAEREQSAFQGLMATLREKQALNAAEIAGGQALTEAQKDMIKFDQDLASGKLVLTKAHEAEVRAIMSSVASQDAYKDAAKKTNAALEALNKERADSVRAAVQEAEAQERLVTEFGLTKRAIDALALSRLKEQLAQRASLGLTLDEIKHLEDLIDAKERSAKAAGTVEVLEKQKKATEDATSAQMEFWKSVEGTAHDTFVSIANGSKDVAQRLKDTLKNTFFDWLYQQTIKKWIINIQTSTAGGGSLMDSLGSLFGGAKGAASAGGASGVSSIGAGGIVGAVVAGMMANDKFFKEGWRLDIADVMKSQFSSMLKGNGFAPIIGSMTGAMGISDKLLGGIFGNRFASMISGSSTFARAFGRRAPTVEAQGIQGTIGAGGFTGQSFAEILEKGGWFRSDKRSTVTGALAAETEATFDKTIQTMVDQVKAFGAVIGAEATAIDGYNKAIKLTLTTDEAKNQQMIADLFGGVGDELSTLLLPNLTALAVEGERASDTLARVAANYTNLDEILRALGDDFGAVGVTSLEARERLISLAGGIDQLAANAQVFADNFLTEAERLKPVQDAVSKGLADLGLSGVTTRDQFKEAVFAIDKTTEAGAKQYATMLELAGAFAAVTASAEDAARAAREAEEARKAAARQSVQDAYGELQKAVSGRQETIRNAFQSVAAGLDNMIAKARANVERMREFAASLRRTAVSISVAAQTSEQAAEVGVQARQQIAAFAAKGKLPSQDLLQKLIESANRQPAGAFGSFEEFQRAQLGTAADLGSLAGVADKRADASERTIAILQAQKTAAEAAYLKEQEQLNAILETAQRQADAAQGTLEVIRDVPGALAALASAIRNAASVGVVVPAFASGGMHSGGVRLVGERGPELEVTGPARYYSAKQTSTMTEGNNSAVVDELRTLNARMATMEQSMALTVRNTGRTAYSSDQLARQFDQVSAGGNALVTEAMA